MLKILPDNYRGDIQVDCENCSRRHQWYLDGELNRKVGTDLAVIYNLNEYPEFTKRFIRHEGRLIGHKMEIEHPQWLQDLYLTGIVPVKVEGVEEPCVGFFWVASETDMANASKSEGCVKYIEWEQHGLVCLRSDKEACDNAINKLLKHMK